MTYVEPNKRCSRCHEQLYRGNGWTHADGKKMHWQDLAWSLPCIAGLAMLVMLGMVFVGALMSATGAGSEYH